MKRPALGILVLLLCVTGCAKAGNEFEAETVGLPNLVGQRLGDLGDTVTDLHELIGVQRTVHLASDTPEGTILRQQPAPGTDLETVSTWLLVVSDGGPAISHVDLTDAEAAFAESLGGYSQSEPLRKITTAEGGVAYKTDLWLFSLDCDAVQSAYRISLDGSYETRCPTN